MGQGAIMTTKQPPAQKHLEMAVEVASRIGFRRNHDPEMTNLANDVIKMIATALAETEAAALASKIEFPSDEEIEEIATWATINKDEQQAFENGARYFKNNLKLTHESAPDMSQKEEKSDVSKEHVISNDINELVISDDISAPVNQVVNPKVEAVNHSAPTSEGFEKIAFNILEAIMERQINYPEVQTDANRINAALQQAFQAGQASRNIRLPSEEFVIEKYQESARSCCAQCEETSKENTRVVAVQHAYKIIKEQVIAMNKGNANE